MDVRVLDLRCPGCGSPIGAQDETCPFCGRPIVISSIAQAEVFDLSKLMQRVGTYQRMLGTDPANAQLKVALGLCQLQLKRYCEAAQAFQEASTLDPTNPDACLYEIIALLGGKKPFSVPRKTIDRIETELQAGIALEATGDPSTVTLLYALWAYVRYDHFARKHLNVSPSYRDLLQIAQKRGLSNFDLQQLFQWLGQSQPSELRL